YGIAVVEVPVHPLDGVRVHVGRGHLHGGGQVDDDLAVRSGLPHVQYRVAHLGRVLQFGPGEGLRAVFVEDAGVRQRLFKLLAQHGTVSGDVHDLVLAGTEHHVALQDGRGVVQMDDGVGGTAQGLVGALNEVLTRLGQDLDGDVRRDAAVLNEAPDKVKVGLTRTGEANLNLLVAHAHQEVE